MQSITNNLERRTTFAGGGLVAFLALLHLVSDAVMSMFSALLPMLQQRFDLAESMLALLVALFSFSALVTQPLFGALADRLGRRMVGAFGVIVNAVLLSMIGVAPTLTVLVALLLLGGLGSAALHPAGMSMVRAAPAARKQLAVSLFSAGGTLGVALGPILVLAIADRFDLASTPWLMLPGLVLGLVMFIVVPAQDRCADEGQCPKLFDRRLFFGPVGLLSIAQAFISLASVTFISAVPLWLVAVHSVSRDSVLLGWTLTVFSLSAAFGGVAAGMISTRLPARWLIPGTLLLAVPPLLALFVLDPGTPLYFLAVILAGTLSHASLPLMIVAAQDLAPGAISTASGMLMGFAGGVGGLLYIAIGYLQESLGLAPATGLGFLALVPGALLALYVIVHYRVGYAQSNVDAVVAATCVCSTCACVPNVPLSEWGDNPQVLAESCLHAPWSTKVEAMEVHTSTPFPKLVRLNCNSTPSHTSTSVVR